MLTKLKANSNTSRPNNSRASSILTVVLKRERNRYDKDAIGNLMLFRLAISLVDGDYVNQV